jgi:hypothetical protein
MDMCNDSDSEFDNEFDNDNSDNSEFDDQDMDIPYIEHDVAGLTPCHPDDCDCHEYPPASNIDRINYMWDRWGRVHEPISHEIATDMIARIRLVMLAGGTASTIIRGVDRVVGGELKSRL